MGVGNLLEIGRTGMQTAQQSMQTTSNNIANANTPGYSRQRVILSPLRLTNPLSMSTPVGVDVQKIVRVHDDFVQNRLHDESATYGHAKARQEALEDVESVMTTRGNQLNENIQKFFNDVRTLSLHPSDKTVRSIVLDSASNVAGSFKEIGESLEQFSHEIDIKLQVKLNEVNDRSNELASLNDNIATLEAKGQPASELKDRRDQVVQKLSQMLGVQHTVDEHGNANLVLAGVGPIVVGKHASSLVLGHLPNRDDVNRSHLELLLKTGHTLHQVTSALRGGEIGGTLQARDEVIRPILGQLDNQAYHFAEAVNRVHEKGTGLNGSQGVHLFEVPDDPRFSALRIQVSKRILENPDMLAAGKTGQGGDNRIALEISDLQDKPVVPMSIQGAPGPEGEKGVAESSDTFSNSVNNMIAHVGVLAQGANQDVSHQEAILNQLNNYRESISGVSLEEEAIHLMQFQHLFQASAKTLRVGDECLQTLMKLKD